MAKRGNSVSDRLKATKLFYEDVRECSPELIPELWATPDRRTASLLRAAAYFKLDLSDAIQSALLLRILADVAFPETGRQKGTKHWSIERLAALGGHWFEVQRTNPDISDNRAAKEIQKRYPKIYHSDQAIRAHLPNAKIAFGPAQNFAHEKAKTPLEALEITTNISSRYARLVLEDLLSVTRERRRVLLKWYQRWRSAMEQARQGLRAEVERLEAKAKKQEKAKGVARQRAAQ